MLQAYFDDSGTHEGSKIMAIGGCVAREEQWTLFNNDWTAMLDDFGLTEYKSADLQAFEGEFTKAQGWDESRRRQLVARAAAIGMKWAKNSFASLVVREDYAIAVPEWAKKTAAFGDEYNFCFQMSIGRIMRWIQGQGVPMPMGEQIAFMFDQQPKREGVARNTYAAIKKFRDPEDRMGTLAFGSGKSFPPLQFADFVAYETYKQLDVVIANSARGVRVPLRILIESLYYLDMSYFGQENLEHLVRDYDQKGRPESGSEPWWPWDGPPDVVK